jgi:hypothetical protein
LSHAQNDYQSFCTAHSFAAAGDGAKDENLFISRQKERYGRFERTFRIFGGDEEI